MDTKYLDVVYLHDVEMVADEAVPKRDGDHSTALGEDREAYGLALGQEGKIWGEGDRKVLEAYGELKRLKEEGLVKNIGITGIYQNQRHLAVTERCSRVSIADTAEACVIDSTDARADGRGDVLLPPHDPERYVYLVCEGAQGEGGCWATPHCLTSMHGVANSEPTRVDPSPQKTEVCILRGRRRVFYLDRRASKYCPGFCLSKCQGPSDAYCCGDGFA